MEIIKVNVRNEINSLEPESGPLILPKSHYKLSMVRSTAANITGDTGKTFSVTTVENDIVVTRKS